MQLIFRFTLVLLVLIAVPLPATAAETGKRVRVGIFQNEPIVFFDADGTPHGLFVDLFEEIARQENWDLEYVPGSWDEGLQRAKHGEVDLILSIAYSDERAVYLDYSSESVLTLWGQVYVGKGSQIADLLDVRGKKIALLKNEINGIAFQKLLESFGLDCHVIFTDTYEKAAQLVATGEVDACVINNIHGAQLANIYEIYESPILFNAFKLLFAAGKGQHPELLAAIDSAVAAWKTDKNSIYFERLRHWSIVREPAREVVPSWLLYLLIVAVCLVAVSLLWIKILYYQIRHRKKAEKSLEESRNFLDSVFDAIQDGISIIDRDMQVIKVNQKMHDWYPDIFSEGIRKCYEIYHGRSTPCEICPSIKTFRSGTLEMDEVPMISEGQQVGVLELYSFPILDKSGAVTGIVEYVRDITQRKEIEQAQRELIAKLQQALEEINTLRGILPVCAYCKKIRDDSGYWNQIEAYISQHSKAKFSHSICPECLQKHSEELFGSQVDVEELKKLIQ